MGWYVSPVKSSTSSSWTTLTFFRQATSHWRIRQQPMGAGVFLDTARIRHKQLDFAMGGGFQHGVKLALALISNTWPKVSLE